MRRAFAWIRQFLQRNSVLVNFYLLIGIFFVIFYALLHWKISYEYIATSLPVVMARNVAWGLRVVGVQAVATGKNVSMPGFSFQIIYHCAGIFGMGIYAAAVVAYPSRWWEKLVGFAIGLPGLYVINTVRMVALGLIGMRWPEMFDWFHEWMWQGIFIIFVIVFWLLWKEKFVRSDMAAAQPEPDGVA